jgi:hypothetical protein
MLYGKVSKLSITFILCTSPDSAPYSVSRVLRDRCQSKLEYVFKVLPLVHCVPMIITSPLFIGFEHMCNDWKLRKLNTSLVLQVSEIVLGLDSKVQISHTTQIWSAQKFQQSGRLQKDLTHKPFTISRCVNNRSKAKNPLYIFSIELKVIFWS